MRMVYLLVSIAIVSLGVGSGIGYWQFSHTEEDPVTLTLNSTQVDLEKAQGLLESFHPKEAMKIIDLHREAITEETETGRKWLSLAILAGVELRDKTQLTALYAEYPSFFEMDEPASLLVAESFLQSGRVDEYADLRIRWNERSLLFPDKWAILDSIRLEMNGERKGAIALLSKQSFEGDNDINRLIRLAVLSLPDSTSEAWGYLGEALKKDPQNADLRMYRAKLLESENRHALAQSELAAAVQTDPKNPFLRNQLADFYIKQLRFSEALKVLVEGLQYPAIEAVWVKIGFLQKVAYPIALKKNQYQIPAGSGKPFIDYLFDLPEEDFWDAKAFQKLPHYHQYLRTQPVSVWLRFLDLIKNKRERDAADLLVLSPFEKGYLNPQLEIGLRRILNYRLNGSLVLNEVPYDELEGTTTARQTVRFDSLPFLDQLTLLAKQQAADPFFELPPEMSTLLKSPLAFVAAFLSQNWNQAAILLNTLKEYPENIPSWVAVKMTRAIQSNYGPTTALKFAQQQPEHPDLQLVMAEILILKKNSVEGEELLVTLKEHPGEIGSRAAWLLSLLYADQKKYELARNTILSHSTLRQEIIGQEGLARIALLQGNIAQAEEIYESIQDSSAEARSYLARKAYLEKNWLKARSLTVALIQEFPNNQLLRDNLNKINGELKVTTSEGNSE